MSVKSGRTIPPPTPLVRRSPLAEQCVTRFRLGERFSIPTNKIAEDLFRATCRRMCQAVLIRYGAFACYEISCEFKSRFSGFGLVNLRAGASFRLQMGSRRRDQHVSRSVTSPRCVYLRSEPLPSIPATSPGGNPYAMSLLTLAYSTSYNTP